MSLLSIHDIKVPGEATNWAAGNSNMERKLKQDSSWYLNFPSPFLMDAVSNGFDGVISNMV